MEDVATHITHQTRRNNTIIDILYETPIQTRRRLKQEQKKEAFLLKQKIMQEKYPPKRYWGPSGIFQLIAYGVY
jgi:hypothetical protein